MIEKLLSPSLVTAADEKGLARLLVLPVAIWSLEVVVAPATWM